MKRVIGYLPKLAPNAPITAPQQKNPFDNQGVLVGLTNKSENDSIQNQNRDLFIKLNDALKTNFELSEKIKELEKRNADLIDISSAAIKYHKEHKGEETKTEENK